jgi:hypothetical protein
MYDWSSLKLPPDQIDKLKDLLVERQMNVGDARQAAMAAGLTPGTPEFAQAMADAQQTNSQGVAAILGPGGENTLAEMQARVGMQNYVGNIAADFADAGAPLSSDQNSAVVQALMDNLYYQGKDTSNRPANYNAVDPSTNLSLHDNRILTSAAPSLTPEQLQVLTQVQQQNEIIRSVTQHYNVTGMPVLGR